MPERILNPIYSIKNIFGQAMPCSQEHVQGATKPIFKKSANETVWTI